MKDEEIRGLLKAQEKRLTAVHERIVTLSDAARALIDDPIGLTYVMCQLTTLGTDHVEEVVKGLATLRAKLEPTDGKRT